MLYKKALIVIFLFISILLIAFIMYGTVNSDKFQVEKKINSETAKRQGHSGPPRFEEYPSYSTTTPQGNIMLDFSDAPEAQKYKDVFEENKTAGKNVLASTYRAVALPCNASSTPPLDVGGDYKSENCYTLWIYDIGRGKVIEIGKEHYKPTELHLRSSLLKSGDEYYVVEGDSARLIYVEWLDYLQTS